MQNFLQNKALHHAHVFVGNNELIRPELFGFFKDTIGVATVANPDFYHFTKDSFLIDDSRLIKDIHSSRPFGEGKRIICIELNFITHEAQNALLKVLEEPHEGTHFFIIIPSLHILIPTIRSRVMVIDMGGKGETRGAGEAFLKLNIKDRIAFVGELATRVSDDDTSKREAIELLNDLEVAIYNTSPLASRRMDAIIRARDYLHDRSPSVKQLLEYVALSV